jgi:hypothetical protein
MDGYHTSNPAVMRTHTLQTDGSQDWILKPVPEHALSPVHDYEKGAPFTAESILGAFFISPSSKPNSRLTHEKSGEWRVIHVQRTADTDTTHHWQLLRTDTTDVYEIRNVESGKYSTNWSSKCDNL